jgi:hypothetical protein
LTQNRCERLIFVECNIAYCGDGELAVSQGAIVDVAVGGRNTVERRRYAFLPGAPTLNVLPNADILLEVGDETPP